MESGYETCLYELERRGLNLARQVALPIVYEGHEIEGGLRLDLLVEDRVIVEVKAVVEIRPVFEARLPTYLKLSGKRLGFLINFTVPLLKDGIKRMIL